MRRMIFIICLIFMLTACTPQTSTHTDPPAASATPPAAASPAPTATPAPAAESALHELLTDYAPQTLNMFRPFDPIAISPEQFMAEMAAIRALPFEERADWFVEHGLCIPEPSEDTDMDWQEETNLWSSYADYRTASAGEIIQGYQDNVQTKWQLVFSDPQNNGGAQRRPYAVLFEQKSGQPWYLIDILYEPKVWNGGHPGHTLLTMQTQNTYSLYDPAQRRILLTVPMGELTVQEEQGYVRYVYDSWKWYPSSLDDLYAEETVVVHLLYEAYPSVDADFSARTGFGGRALIYKMEDRLPTLAQDSFYPSCDPQAFLSTKAKEFLHKDYVCPEYSKKRGAHIDRMELHLTETRTLTAECIEEYFRPLRKNWRDQTPLVTSIRISENGEYLQTIEIAELAELAATHPDTDGGFTLYPEAVPYGLETRCDYNLDGFNDLRIRFQELPAPSYYLLWSERKQEYVFWRANSGEIQIDKETRTLTYENELSNYAGTHTDHILPDGTIEHATLTVTDFIIDPPGGERVMLRKEICDPPKEYIRQNNEWIEVQP